MTNRELADAAWLELTKTTDAYPRWVSKGKPASSHWAKAKTLLDQVRDPETPPPPPPASLTVTQTITSGQVISAPVIWEAKPSAAVTR